MEEELTPAMLAEMAGAEIACQMIDPLFASTNQADASKAFMTALNEAFNADDDATTTAVITGFAGVIVNLLERGRDAIRSDRSEFAGGESE